MIQDIIDLVSRQHFQIACQRYFEATHNTELDGGIQHPNQYFQDSQKILNGDVKEKALPKTKVQTTRATLPSKQEVKSETNDETLTNAMDSDDDYNYSTLDAWYILRFCLLCPSTVLFFF